MFGLTRSAILCLLLANAFFRVASRKVKRTETYLHVPPPPAPAPQPQPTPSAAAARQLEPEPYPYEDVNEHDYHSQPAIVHYESNFTPTHPTQTQAHAQTQHSYTHSAASNGKYLIDNGLRSIARGSADQANSAVASQNAAGKQAAYVAKSTLAQAAAQAAGTAVAVLKGKEVLLRRLEEQNVEEHKALEGELAQLHQAKRSAKTAQYAAQQAINHVSVLTAALNNAQSASELTQRAASEAAAELASQIDMVAQAKSKLEQIESQLYTARLDYEETKKAAEKATQSAQEAQYNANDAAVHANVELSESVHVGSHEKSAHQVGAVITVDSANHNYGAEATNK
ncbi:myosin-2 heavy chain [Eurosta solidaginis]|uniref:myosin-2 heavy chain n=1 Tax=Eurosta solidaginis TaxID=178769 RepID=UPI0035309B04